MKSLSADLRERIVVAYEAGEGTQEEIGKRFSVSQGVVGKFVRQDHEFGSIEMFLHRWDRKPAISGESADRLRNHLEQYRDARVP